MVKILEADEIEEVTEIEGGIEPNSVTFETFNCIEASSQR